MSVYIIFILCIYEHILCNFFNILLNSYIGKKGELVNYYNEKIFFSLISVMEKNENESFNILREKMKKKKKKRTFHNLKK